MPGLIFRKKVLLLSIILSVLVVTYVLGIIFSPHSIRKRKAEIPLFTILNKDLVTRIEIADSEEGKVELRKTDEAWTVRVGGLYFPASATRIDSFLDGIIALKRSKVITQDPALWEDFAVTDEQGHRLRLWDKSDRDLVDLQIGKSGLAGAGNYVRIQGEDEVIQVDRSLSSYLDTGTKYWSYLKLFPRDLEGRDLISIQIRSTVFEGNALAYTLVLEQEEGKPLWKSQGQEDLILSPDKMERLANSLASFEGTEFVVDISEDDAGLSSPGAEINFRTSDDRFYRLLVGKELTGKDQYYVKLVGQTYSYLAAKWRLEGVLKPLTELEESDSQS